LRRRSLGSMKMPSGKTAITLLRSSMIRVQMDCVYRNAQPVAAVTIGRAGRGCRSTLLFR
jgi:hypothetical protein